MFILYVRYTDLLAAPINTLTFDLIITSVCDHSSHGLYAIVQRYYHFLIINICIIGQVNPYGLAVVLCDIIIIYL